MTIDISIVIPVYNSSESIKELVTRIVTTLEKEEATFEIILVDDFSKDDSVKMITELNKNDPRVIVMALKNNSGQQVAIKTGMKLAAGDVVITIDDDLEYQPEDIPLLLSALKKSGDVVYGIPNREGYPLYRQFGSNLVDLFFNICLHKPKDIRVGSFRILNRKTVNQIIDDKIPFVYITAITLTLTKNIGNVTVNHQERKYGKSNYNLKKLTKLFLNLFYYYRKASI
ncbi:MAG: glycosyltransferase family 2 protein [Eubacteriaceae bacterium]|nr:glycosyltransferase family 2 protein [Eubacteriaceae bacterium]